MQALIVLEMNEVNFDYVRSYIEMGYLRNFKYLFERNGFSETSSETEYSILEPWIQWVSARTGQTYKQHGVYRLGDITESKAEQHWEVLEARGRRVAAVSPINGANRTKESPFWIPDPWVVTPVSGNKFAKDLARAIKQAVNDNASDKLTGSTKLILLKALAANMGRVRSWPHYASSITGILKRQHWSRAVLLDRLLADVFFGLWRKHRPDFSTLFLNSAAHIQHHYMFNSKAYKGTQKNPNWYVDEAADPILDIYSLYDVILGEAIRLDARVMVATGLRQVPYEKVTFYYRLKSHEKFLASVNVFHQQVLPRMSRDFLVVCSDSTEAAIAGERLESLRSASGDRIFIADNRGDSLFVTLIYANEIRSPFQVFDEKGSEVVRDFYEEVAFVAIKNGHHDATGYFMDSDARAGAHPTTFALEDIYTRVVEHFG